MKNQLCSQEYLWDFSVDGGAVSAIALSSKNGKDSLPLGAVVVDVVAKVETLCTSGGSATLAWGPTADADGFSGPAIAVASLTAGAVFGREQKPALLQDDTAKAAKYHSCIVANDADFKVTIGTAAMTAGKVSFTVLYVYPAVKV